jgi:two-component system chemotaxis sensor kinase CheA
MNLDDALQTFYAESRDMLEEMEHLLLELESDADDPEKLDALFRCVHTIKGSAGIFGLDHVVKFTHVVENVLDRLRERVVDLDNGLSALLLRARDHISTLIELDANDLPDTVSTEGDGLSSNLAAYLADDSVSTSSQKTDVPVVERVDHGVGSDIWHISVRFTEDILRHGMDPAGFIRYLGTLGKVTHVTTLIDSIPAVEDFDAEACYLGFEIALDADTDKTTIEAVFEFVRDECDLRIIPPHSKLQQYIELVEALPENDARLGDILVASGALTPVELQEGLSKQQIAAANDKGSSPRIGEVLLGAGAVQQEVVDVALTKQKESREARVKASQYVRVQADKLDSLINLVGELVIASAAAGLSAQRNGDTRTQEAVAAVSGLVEDIRDGSLELRMVPIGETFQRFQRVVRDVSKELGKEIRLEISGADTELDKTVVEKIADPLTHLVRNAVDHGIEPAEVRKDSGKALQGTVRLNAFHDAGSIVIEVSDDGGGLNRQKIRQKAVQRKLIEDTAELSDSEILNLIFEPGFSTAEAVTDLSGRGVGMDVVKRNIEALRGTVEVQSTVGVGSTFRIRLPLTLAIIDGFLTGVGPASYVVPLESMAECVELTAEQTKGCQGRDLINLRGEVLPFIRLRDYFDVGGEPPRRENIVVVSHAGYKAGLIVDDLLGEYQTVIKPLGRLFSSLGGISGSTILGSGDVALILDVPALVQQAAEKEGRSFAATDIIK